MIAKAITRFFDRDGGFTPSIPLDHGSSIYQKWESDCRLLPLTSKHRDLYIIIHREYFRKLGTYPDLVNCRGYNDLAQWLKLFDQRREIVICSDKIRVRERVLRRLGEQALVGVYQVRENFSDINMVELPKSFVLKTNHDSGGTIIVRDKENFDFDGARLKVEQSLAQPYGWLKGEWAYKFIKPLVFVEEMIEFSEGLQPPDYKVFCVNGKARFVHYIYDRGLATKEQVISLDGKDLNTSFFTGFALGHDFIKPRRWDDIISAAETMSKGFRFVRVDLYCVDNRIYFGEMTFWPGAGFYLGEGQRKLGALLQFSRTKAFRPIVHELEKTSHYWPD